jgi:hypothetical protein
MQQRRMIAGAAIVVLGGIGFYLFRPDTLVTNKTVNDSFPGATTAQAASGTQPSLLASGSFHGVAHRTDGTASIYQSPDGKRTLRLSNFATSNGPALHVYLVAAEDAKDNNTIKKAGFVDLGALKGNRGDQNYTVPADVDLDRYRAVTIWCRRFGVNFATAPLMPEASAASTQPALLAMGSFHGVAHRTDGKASIYETSDGKRTLRLSDFATSNGPALHVYLVAAEDAKDNDTIKKTGFVDLGALKGNRGDQNYTVPDDVDLDKYRAVTIWCRRFGVNFATAPLMAEQS